MPHMSCTLAPNVPAVANVANDGSHVTIRLGLNPPPIMDSPSKTLKDSEKNLHSDGFHKTQIFKSQGDFPVLRIYRRYN